MKSDHMSRAQVVGALKITTGKEIITGFAKNYNFYDAGKFYPDYLYSSTHDVMGSWKHYNRSAATFNERNNRAKSPLISRELDRFMKHKPRRAMH